MRSRHGRQSGTPPALAETRASWPCQPPPEENVQLFATNVENSRMASIPADQAKCLLRQNDPGPVTTRLTAVCSLIGGAS